MEHICQTWLPWWQLSVVSFICLGFFLQNNTSDYSPNLFGVSFIAGVTVSPDCFLTYLGDSYCDDMNNFSYCNYDYGDCCLTESNEITGNNVNNYCESCLCKSNETGYPSTFGTPPPGPPAAGPPGQPQGQPPMYVNYWNVLVFTLHMLV